MRMNNKTIALKLNLGIVCIVLVVIIIGMLALWRPWSTSSSGTTRKITINGQASVKAEPNEFVFNPIYEWTGADSEAKKAEQATFANKLKADLTKLGIAESAITIQSNTYQMYVPALEKPVGETTPDVLSLTVTIKAPNKELAQKVQDYLGTTNAKGQLTPYPQFSESKQKELQSQARLNAIADARKQADSTASNLKVSIGKVLEVTDQNSGYGCGPSSLCVGSTDAASPESRDASLPVTAGESSVSASVTVVFSLN